MISHAQRRALLEALGSPELRIPVDHVRQSATRIALTGSYWAGEEHHFDPDAWMTYYHEAGQVYLKLTRAGAAQLGAEALADFDARNLDPTDEIVASYGPDGRWDSDSARQVFATAYHQARFRGLSAVAAEAVLRNVVAAVEHELTFRQKGAIR